MMVAVVGMVMAANFRECANSLKGIREMMMMMGIVISVSSPRSQVGSDG